MTLKQLLIIMLLATAICWLSWLTVVWQIDPTETAILGPGLFYLSLFFSLIGTLFLISFTWRKMFCKYAMDYKIVSTSFRQSIFFSLIVVGILYLQSQNLLNWWSVSLVVIVITLIEGFFLSMRKQA